MELNRIKTYNLCGGYKMVNDREIKEFLVKEFRLISHEGIITKSITEGYSGAEVYLLIISNAARSRDNGNYILKIIDTTSQWFSKTDNEANKSEEIYEKSTQYHQHLVKVRAKKYIGDKLVIVYFYALKSRLNSITLDKNQIDVKCKLLESISYELLECFNNHDISIVKIGGYQVLKSWLKYRIEKQNNFEIRIGRLLYSQEKPAFNYKGCILPNPLYYITRLDEYIDGRDLQFLKGKIHGDFHQKNILTHKVEKENDYDYVVIDYDSFEKDNFLFFDHAYLELNILNEELQGLDIYSWHNVIKTLIQKGLEENTQKSEKDYNRCEYVRDSICLGIMKWHKKKYPELIDNIKIQYDLSRIAAAINYLCKNGIKDSILQTKYLIYAAISMEVLFEHIGVTWDKEDTGRLRERDEDSNYTEFVWKACDRFKREYTKILFTDDNYRKENYKEIEGICRIEWTLVVDIGDKSASQDLHSDIASKIKQNRNYMYINSEKSDGAEYTNNTCFWLEAKRKDREVNLQHWLTNKKSICNSIINIIGSSPLKPVLFVFDCQKDAHFMNKTLEWLLEKKFVKKGMIVVGLGSKADTDIQSLLSMVNVSQAYNENANLIDISSTAIEYGINRGIEKKAIIIPSISNLSGEIAVEELEFYESSVELVYDGIEKLEKNYDYGKSFYKGNEITWLDLEQNNDIPFHKYNEKLAIIIEKLEKFKTPVYRLIHAAGAGGTTLAKRLMWDIKSTYPVVRIKKFTSDTINILAELYRKSGKCIFAVIEMGSTVISEEEFLKLVSGVDAQSCRTFFLRVERLGNIAPNKFKGNEKTDIILDKELHPAVAKRFLNDYCKMTNDINRIRNLECITYERDSQEWGEQCCPFFYGFYTFQDEYEGLNNFLRNTLLNCSEELKNILSDLSVITLYSQNICISYEEMLRRLNIDGLTYYEIFEKLDESVIKILSQREQGFRICHPLIARKILEHVYEENGENKIYFATIDFVNRINDIYGNEENIYVDKIFRELFIDRSYIDGEKQYFSEIIAAIPKQSLKKKVFQHLISLYPENPHYYNHLGRLEAFDAYKDSGYFEPAIVNLHKAIKIAENQGLDLTSHYTTLACIYSRKVVNYISSLKRDRKQISIERIFDNIRCDFGNATDYFLMARNKNYNNTYGYFPNILMICNVINHIVGYTKKDVNLLLEDVFFKEWYDYNVGIAVQLYTAMENNCEDEILSNLSSRAQTAIDKISGNIAALKEKLNRLEKRGFRSKEMGNIRRTITSMLYIRNQYSWENMDIENLQYAKDAMYDNMVSGNYTEVDVINWFDLYRRTEEFDTHKAVEVIEEYMKNGYYKEYILWILNFLLYKKGLVTFNLVEEHLSACRRETEKIYTMLRTSRFIDAYSNTQYGCPVKQFRYIEKDENDRLRNLKEFGGMITKIDGTTKGTILLEELNLKVFFTPSFTDELGNKREFSSKHETEKVIFNLMFTYSGLRAWNVKLAE